MTFSSNGLRFLSIWILWSAAIGIAACMLLERFGSQRIATLLVCSALVAVGCAMELVRQKRHALMAIPA